MWHVVNAISKFVFEKYIIETPFSKIRMQLNIF